MSMTYASVSQMVARNPALALGHESKTAGSPKYFNLKFNLKIMSRVSS